MNLRFFKLGMFAVLLTSFASLVAIILLVNPFNASRLNLGLFSGVLFLFLFGLFSWLGFYARTRFITEKSFDRILKMAFRQGVLVALLAVIYLWLNHFSLLKVWTILLVLFLVSAIEYYFLTRHEYHHKIIRS